jgi:hypothetical protein
MEDLLARYLDGDLDEAGAAELLRRSREDPTLARELREYESLLEAAERLGPERAPDGFAGRVLDAVTSEHAAPRRTGFSRTMWLAAAAGLAIGVLVGGWASGLPSPVPGPGASSEPAGLALLPAPPAVEPGVEFHRAVWLVYAPSRPDVHTVAVAGSFNGWDPDATPMIRKDGRWSVLLVLPPGDHEYMIVEDGTRWVTDPFAPRTRRDGFGGVNGLLDVRS